VPPKPTTGAALFKDFCANCHGADGKGGVTMRNITSAPANTAAMYLSNVRGGHHPGEFGNRREFMPKWTAAQLTDAEVRLIFNFVVNKM
jgi:mono/diheme cytochrome c family protein